MANDVTVSKNMYHLTLDLYDVICANKQDRESLGSCDELTSVWRLCDLWPHKCITLRSRVLLTKFGSHMKFLGKLTSDWPLHDLLPHNVSHSLLTKFGSHRTILTKLTSGWPLHDLWPHRCIILSSRVLLTKFGSHMTFLDKLIFVWPMHWPLTPQMYYTQVKGSFDGSWLTCLLWLLN